jgi:hypothetical protein
MVAVVKENKDLDLIVNFYLKTGTNNEKQALKAAILKYAERINNDKSRRSGSNIKS